MEKEKNLSLGQKVELKKREKNLSNNALARLVNVSGQTIANIISGATEQPKPNLIVNLSKALDVTVDWLIENETSDLKELFKSGIPKKYNYEAYTPLNFSVSLEDNTKESLTQQVKELVHQVELFDEKVKSLQDNLKSKDEIIFAKNQLIEQLNARVTELEAKVAIAREIVKGSKDATKLF